MIQRELIFIDKVSLKSDRVTLFTEILKRVPGTNDIVNIRKKCISESNTGTQNPVVTSPIASGAVLELWPQPIRAPFENTAKFPLPVFDKSIEKKFHNFEISTAAQRNIREKINWLYTLARSRYVKTYSGKEIFNFKLNFLTLTLPSKQCHPTSEITNLCFNQFLTEIRSRVKMENYVWRLEFQKNGNVHYHIVTDVFIDYFFAQKIWNRIINKLGYVDAYTAKFKGFSLQQYLDNCEKNDKNDFSVLSKRYAKGCSEGWKNPNSVDVKSCTSNKTIAFYISKYFSKDKDNSKKCNDLDNEENSFGLRLWFCSRSLSKLTSICDYREALSIDWFSFLKGAENVRHVICDYAQCLFFDLSKLTNYLKSVLFPVFRNYATSQGYSSA